jgi:hypothetical protein
VALSVHLLEHFFKYQPLFSQGNDSYDEFIRTALKNALFPIVKVNSNPKATYSCGQTGAGAILWDEKAISLQDIDFQQSFTSLFFECSPRRLDTQKQLSAIFVEIFTRDPRGQREGASFGVALFLVHDN